ncbi:ArsR/SmtB family transcription factor [Amnibacterium kyonggiense]|uniref:ArsR family transcriptional regulator n=1 Tax=Amnibacterium kyonggiense TaxID=595671 RepID=A0A4V3EAF2_9MICO|nr:helix-turn-helix transcriptional regulator [Amnibacterium kyonggiense]TDS76148.1 ArsR family transcriptional regulator [Amnibacterium kyonggiense]
MSNNSAEYPTPDLADVELVDVLRALGDPIRLQMLRVLADGVPHSKSMQEWGFDVQKSTMSHHFRTMREAGLTETIVDGRSHAIRLRREALDARFPGLIESLLASAVSGR